MFVQAAKLRLIMVVVSRSKKRSAQSASRHIREIALDWIGRHNIDLVKIALSESKCVPLEKISIGRHNAILTELVELRGLL